MLKTEDTFSPEKEQVRQGINRLVRETFRKSSSPKHFLTLPGVVLRDSLEHGVERFILQQYPKAVLHLHEKDRSRREKLQTQVDSLPLQQRQRIRLHGRDILQGPVGLGSSPISGAWFDLYGGHIPSVVDKLHRLFEMAAFEERCVVALTFGVLESRHGKAYVGRSPKEVVLDLLVKARRYHYHLSDKPQELSYQAERYQMFSFWWSFSPRN